MARPFDPGRLAFAGDAVPIAEQVGVNAEKGFFSASATGILAYRGGIAEGSQQVTWYDRSGKPVGSVTGLGSYNSLAISPDGTRVALERDPAGAGDIWLHEFARGTTDRLTFDPARELAPVWSPHSDRVVFASRRDGPDNLYQKASSNAEDQQSLLKSGLQKYPTDWSRDGRFLLYEVNDPKNSWDLWVLPMGDKGVAPAAGSGPAT